MEKAPGTPIADDGGNGDGGDGARIDVVVGDNQEPP